MHTLLDIENHALTRQVLEIIERVTPLPKRKENKRQPGSERSGRLSITAAPRRKQPKQVQEEQMLTYHKTTEEEKSASPRGSIYRGVCDL